MGASLDTFDIFAHVIISLPLIWSGPKTGATVAVCVSASRGNCACAYYTPCGEEQLPCLATRAPLGLPGVHNHPTCQCSESKILGWLEEVLHSPP